MSLCQAHDTTSFKTHCLQGQDIAVEHCEEFFKLHLLLECLATGSKLHRLPDPVISLFSFAK